VESTFTSPFRSTSFDNVNVDLDVIATTFPALHRHVFSGTRLQRIDATPARLRIANASSRPPRSQRVVRC
jgi:hypothetical protein